MSNISPLASVHKNAVIGNDVTIEPFVFIDDEVSIGDGTRVCANAVISIKALKLMVKLL